MRVYVAYTIEDVTFTDEMRERVEKALQDADVDVLCGAGYMVDVFFNSVCFVLLPPLPRKASRRIDAGTCD